MDWPDGTQFSDFLGFAILRSPGFHQDEKDRYLLNKVGFVFAKELDSLIDCAEQRVDIGGT
jgi:hypothetical protein